MQNNINFLVKTKKAGLFQIPNPYDECRRDKDEWNLKVEKLENKIDAAKKVIDEMLEKWKSNLN